MKRLQHYHVLALLAALTAAPTTRAQTIYIGPASGNWDTVSNWATGSVPGAGDTAVIDTRVQDSTVTISSSQTRSILNLDINAGDSLVVSNNANFNIIGDTIDIDGELLINAGGNATDLFINNAAGALSGAGSLVLGGAGNARVLGAGQLTNTATIEGRGSLGVNQLAIVNAAGGLIDANVTGAQLLVDPRNGDGLSNQGTMRASDGGILRFTGNGGGAFDNTGGTIEAMGAGSEVRLTNSASITGGTLHTESNGLIRGEGSETYFFTGVTLDAGTQVQTNNNSDFGVSGTITNEGTITIAAAGNATDILLQNDTIFNGSGEVILSSTVAGSSNAGIHGGGILTNEANHTIRGHGGLGVNNIGVVNNGTVRADTAGAHLFVDPASANGFDNNSIMEAIGGGILRLTGSGGGAFQNHGATIRAMGEGSEVRLTSSASIVGGTLHTEANGLIRGEGSENYFFRDVTFDAGTQVQADNNSDFGVSGTITNDGTVTIAAAGNSTDIELQNSTAFLGSGEVVLSNTNNARVIGTGTLTNGPGHTIRGRGQLGVNSISVFNSAGGTIEADVNGASLVLDPVNGTGTFDNRGLLAASNGASLILTGSGGGTFDNTSGTIRAGDESEVHLTSGSVVDGGTLESMGSGSIVIPGSQTATIRNAIISANSIIHNNGNLILGGEITHSGELTIAAGGNSTDLILGSLLDLIGGGVINMIGGNARILGNGFLINRDHVISGSGQIGVNQAGLTNTAGGTIHANASGGTINIDPNAFLGFVNDGTLRASNGGRLNLSGSGGGQFTFGESSVVEALDGGSITHSSSAVLTNVVNGVLSDGTYRAIDEGNGASIALPGGNITTNAATIELSGNGATFSQLNALEQNDGKLSVAKGASLNTSRPFTQSAGGSLEVHIDGKPNEPNLWGSLVTAAAATLNGTLDVFFNLGESFAATVGDTWKVLTSATRNGEFAAVNFTAEGLPANSELAVNYLEDGMEVEVIGAAPLQAVSYANWIAAVLPDGADLSPEADWDRDGASNLEEYAFAMDPRVPDSQFLPKTFLMEKEGVRFLAITYERPASASARPDITYTVERSIDLLTWSSGDAVGEPDVIDQELSRVTVRCAEPVGREMEFLRVAVSLR